MSSSIVLAIAIAAAQATSASVSLQPTSASLQDSVPAGTVVATATVENSNGSAAPSCNLTSSMPSLFGVSGCNVVTARALSTADDGHYQVTISAQPLPTSSSTSPAGTIVCAPNSAKYCTGNAAQLTWQGHTFAFEPQDVNNQQGGGNYSLLLDGKDASCGATLGQWTGYELAIDTKGQLHLRINPTASPAWAAYDDSGTDTCFTNLGEPAPTL